MKPQTPATGIMLTKDFGDSKYYKVDCECGQPDDSIVFNVEVDDGSVTVHTWTTQKTSWWDDPFKANSTFRFDPEWLWFLQHRIRNILNSIAHRVQVTWCVWIHGYVDYESYTIMTEQQTLNYAETLKQAINDIKEYKKNAAKKL